MDGYVVGIYRRGLRRFAHAAGLALMVAMMAGCPQPDSPEAIVFDGNPDVVTNPTVSSDGSGLAVILHREPNTFRPTAQAHRFAEGMVEGVVDLWEGLSPPSGQGAQISSGLTHALAMDESGQAVALTQRLARSQTSEADRNYTLFEHRFASETWSDEEELRTFGEMG